MVKNVGDGAARAIIAAREEGGLFVSIWDFTERVDPSVVNKRALESLVKCGALDSTGATWRGMLEALPAALQSASARIAQGVPTVIAATSSRGWIALLRGDLAGAQGRQAYTRRPRSNGQDALRQLSQRRAAGPRGYPAIADRRQG